MGGASGLIAASLERVVRARHLPAREGVAARTLSRADLIAQVRAHVQRDVPRDVVRAQGDVLLALGLIPIGYKFEQGIFELLEAQLAGYYEPSDKTMYLAGDLNANDADATLAHELVHALQDQHYDIGSRLHYQPEGGDVSSAIQSLAEGDATSAMIDVLAEGHGTALDVPEEAVLGQMRKDSLAATGQVPRVLKSSLTAPYLDGLRFVHAQRRRGGWAAVDRVWNHLPISTEQILHPEKYESFEAPVAIAPLTNQVLDGGFHVVFTDVGGEQNLRVTFEEWGDRRQAAAAAAGWGGDRVSLLARERGGSEERLVVWRIRFDGAGAACPEAKEAFRLVAQGVLGPRKKPNDSLACRLRADLGPLAVGRQACDVLIVGGPYGSSGTTRQSKATCPQVEAWIRNELREAPR